MLTSHFFWWLFQGYAWGTSLMATCTTWHETPCTGLAVAGQKKQSGWRITLIIAFSLKKTQNADHVAFLEYSSGLLYSLLVGPLTTLCFVTASIWASSSSGLKDSIPFPYLRTGTCPKRNIPHYPVTGNIGSTDLKQNNKQPSPVFQVRYISAAVLQQRLCWPIQPEGEDP